MYEISRFGASCYVAKEKWIFPDIIVDLADMSGSYQRKKQSMFFSNFSSKQIHVAHG